MVLRGFFYWRERAKKVTPGIEDSGGLINKKVNLFRSGGAGSSYWWRGKKGQDEGGWEIMTSPYCPGQLRIF